MKPDAQTIVCRVLGWSGVCFLGGVLLLGAPRATASDFFAIRVVDDQTGRGVPLVELRTVHGIRFFTDSDGVAAFYEPGLMNQDVFFFVESHGYEFPKDGFGYRGRRVRVTPGGSVTWKIRRLNIAERLYRITGAGIYRDSILLGQTDRVPIRRPVLNAKVLGSDSVVNAVYRGRLYWFWGDTNRPSYPLGNFHVPGATSLLPEDGGLPPDHGVDLEYFIGEDGFAKPTARMPGPGPTWINGLVVLLDSQGRERLVAHYVKVKPPLTVYEHGLCVFDEESEEFVHLVTFPKDAPFYPHGHPFLHEEKETRYVYFADPFPLLRAPADFEALQDLGQYEAFTCLEAGTHPDQPRVDRDASGRVRYSWKRSTPFVSPAQQAKLLRDAQLQPGDVLLPLQDVETGRPVQAHRGSVFWNAYRKRWIMIAVETFGDCSALGEVWYAEADTPLGPWVYAAKVVTHRKYSFYNPKQHPYFDQQGGRLIYFEGTYTNTFSGNPDRTPRYNYNQIMYRLDLSDPRLFLPVPVYVCSSSENQPLPCDNQQTAPSEKRGRNGRHGPDIGPAGRTRVRPAPSTGAQIRPDSLQVGWKGPSGSPLERPIAFFAPDRPRPGTVPVQPVIAPSGHHRLVVVYSKTSSRRTSPPLFYAFPVRSAAAPNVTVPLYEFFNPTTGQYAYSVSASWSAPGFEAGRPICRIWKSPWPTR